MGATDNGSLTAIGRGRMSRGKFITKKLMEQEDMEQELFEAVAGLAAEFGSLTVILAMQQVLEMEVEADACCTTCQRKSIWLNRELSRLLSRYQSEFPEMGAVARINSLGPRGGMIQ
jgi:hypothetical protein